MTSIYRSASITTTDHSSVVGTTAVTVLTTAQIPLGAQLLALANQSSAGNTIWLSRAGVAAVGAPGSWPLIAGASETYMTPVPIFANPLSAVASAPGALLCIEVG